MVMICDHPAVIDQILVDSREFFTDLHSTPPLILIVLSSRLGVQSATEISRVARVLHIF